MKVSVFLALVATSTTAMKLNPNNINTVQVKTTESEKLNLDVDSGIEEFNMIWKKINSEERTKIKMQLRTWLDIMIEDGEDLTLDDLWDEMSEIY